jgi:hypothetical protein
MSFPMCSSPSLLYARSAAVISPTSFAYQRSLWCWASNPFYQLWYSMGMGSRIRAVPPVRITIYLVELRMQLSRDTQKPLGDRALE